MAARFIIHLADIHIGSGLRTAEYQQVFDNFSAIVSNFDPANTIIVIAGDIFHHKVKYSGEDVDLFNYLIEKIAKYHTIIIPGNHDANLNDLNRIDLISPLCDHNIHTQLHYLKNSGWFTLRGLDFYHISVFDESNATQIERMIRENLKFRDTILLYHGMINGARFGQHVANETRITAEVISSVKLLLAGDIHEYQFVAPNAAYCGSIIQQNIGESSRKDIIIWDLEKSRNKFVEIKNDYGFVKLDLRGLRPEQISTAIIDLNKNKPQNIHKVSIVTDADDVVAAAQVEQVRAVTGRVDRVNRIENKPQVINPAEDIIAVLGDLLIRAGASDELRNEIIVMHSNKIVAYEYSKWHVTRLTFDYMFKYG